VCFAIAVLSRHLRPSRDADTPSVIRLLQLFSLVYLPLMELQSIRRGQNDRYFLPLMPLIVLWLLRGTGAAASAVPSKWRDGVGWSIVVVFALYAIASTHDYIAQARARTQAADELERAGISRTAITAGFEYDAWTQLRLLGYMNDP